MHRYIVTVEIILDDKGDQKTNSGLIKEWFRYMLATYRSPFARTTSRVLTVDSLGEVENRLGQVQ